VISRLLLAALSAAAIALPAAVAPAHQGAAQRDWTQNVARTPEGGFRLGNPNAPGGGRGGAPQPDAAAITAGRSNQAQREWYRPWPATGEFDWSLRNNTNYGETGVLTALQYTSQFPKIILENFYVKSRNSVETGRKHRLATAT